MHDNRLSCGLTFGKRFEFTTDHHDLIVLGNQIQYTKNELQYLADYENSHTLTVPASFTTDVSFFILMIGGTFGLSLTAYALFQPPPNPKKMPVFNTVWSKKK